MPSVTTTISSSSSPANLRPSTSIVVNTSSPIDDCGLFIILLEI